MSADSDRMIELQDASYLFILICKDMKQTYRSKFPLTKETCLEHTIANVDFKAIQNKYNFRTYKKHFKFLTDLRAILKVNLGNPKCHRYYINPDFRHNFVRNGKVIQKHCNLYYYNYSYLWDKPFTMLLK